MGEGVLRLRPGSRQDLPRHYEPKFAARVGTLYSRFASRAHGHHKDGVGGRMNLK